MNVIILISWNFRSQHHKLLDSLLKLCKIVKYVISFDWILGSQFDLLLRWKFNAHTHRPRNGYKNSRDQQQLLPGTKVILYKTLCYLFTMLSFFWHRKHSNIVKSHKKFRSYKNYVLLCYYANYCLVQNAHFLHWNLLRCLKRKYSKVKNQRFWQSF